MITLQAADYIRANYGFVVLRSAADLDDFERVTADYSAGRLDAATLRKTLRWLGVEADAIRRVLAGERLTACC